MIQFSTASRNAQAQAHETTVGASPILRFRTGPPPANCAAARSGTILTALALPADWASVSGGVLSRVGTWEDLTADASGEVGHYELMDSTGTTCHEQGTVSALGGGGDIVLQQATADIVAGQRVIVDGTWTRTWGGL